MSWEHVNKYRKAGECSVKGCNKKHQARGYCKVHWAKWRRAGVPTPFSFRTPNEVTVKGNTTYMTLYKGITNVPIGQTKFSAEDETRVKQFKWGLNRGYVVNSHGQLANFITGFKWTDHINGDTLDNRRENLRVVSRYQNILNRGGQLRNRSSKYKCVSYENALPKRPWRAYIQVDKRKFTIGRFGTEEEAAWMYDQWALELFGDYARTNFHYSSKLHDPSGEIS